MTPFFILYIYIIYINKRRKASQNPCYCWAFKNFSQVYLGKSRFYLSFWTNLPSIQSVKNPLILTDGI